jgi:beta-lactamase superfamily II metal-dependent hydrolase
MDYERYQKKAKEWDHFPTYDVFVSLTAEEELNYLYTDDELKICGLNVQVFSAYDDSIKKDLANLGSLVFRIESEQDSVLFCSDVYGEAMSKRIADKYGDRLESTYIQMGHHGNNSVKSVLIDCVKPEVALFDAPEWLVYGEKYDTIQNIELLQKSGAECYTYETAPNQFILK